MAANRVRAARVQVEGDPFAGLLRDEWGERWPAHWVWPAGCVETPCIAAVRLRFTVDEANADRPMRLHLSADQRYELYIDGAFAGRGPERCAPLSWAFESYDLTLPAGQHVLVARVWDWGLERFLTPLAQMSVRRGFLLAAEGAAGQRLGTGLAAWEGMRLGGHTVHPRNVLAGGVERVDGPAFDWGFQAGRGEGWRPVEVVEQARTRDWPYGEVHAVHHLRPAMIGPLLDDPRRVGRVRYATADPSEPTPGGRRGAGSREAAEGSEPEQSRVDLDRHDPRLAELWQALVTGGGAVTVPADAKVQVVIDLEQYHCGYPHLTIVGGAGGEVQLTWTESLHDEPSLYATKGDRDEIDGKFSAGRPDVFIPAGGSEPRAFGTLWWRAGRYVQLVVRTADEPAVLSELGFRAARYPLVMEHELELPAEPVPLVERLGSIQPLLKRGLLMCLGDDCPFYEQLQYTGDARVQALVVYATSRDDAIPRRAMHLWDISRLPSGLSQSRYPCFDEQVIPPFALWWVAMVHDFAKWRDDPAFVRSLLPGVRSAVEAFRAKRNGDGLIEAVDGWNFVDWLVDDWDRGVPPGGRDGVSSAVNWQVVMALGHKAQLEEHVGDADLARRDRRAAEALAESLVAATWDERQGLLADTPGGERFSEHTQCLAQLAGGLAADDPRGRRMLERLWTPGGDPGMSHTTMYFRHYLFEAAASAGRPDVILDRMGPWWRMLELGLKTPLEQPEPSRSDCHAWASHPLYHMLASLLGVRPGGWGFGSVQIEPQLGPMPRLRGAVPHPAGGMIRVDVRQDGDQLTGEVELPAGLTGSLRRRGLADGHLGEGVTRF
jgi:hypothetical protein